MQPHVNLKVVDKHYMVFGMHYVNKQLSRTVYILFQPIWTFAVICNGTLVYVFMSHKVLCTVAN